ncbi:MAG: elongation factor-1 alpha [Aquificae bacterium]|nr:elongation factor-1 alpha [Aquificota bacterium]
MNWLNLTKLTLPVKVLFTSYLLISSLGFIVAGVLILLTHGLYDGKFGVSIDDIVYSYYGKRDGSKLEVALRGSMKPYATEEERKILIDWVRRGAPDEEIDKKIMPIIQKRCASCHSQMPELDITKKEVLKQMAEVDTGISISRLTKLSHIHLFGMSFIFMFIGFIFSFSIGINRILKSVLIAVPFVFQFIDILAWWLTKFLPWFAWFVIAGGFGYFVASWIMIVISLYQMWFMKPVNKNSWLWD